jgi:hypothetical protein
MEARYSIHGLLVSSSFELRGAFQAPAVPIHLPRLRLDQRSPPELERSWLGAQDAPIWQGRLGDGTTLVLERASDGALLFTHASRAQFLLSAGMEQLFFAGDSTCPESQRALIGKVLPAISVMRGYEALHASVIDSPEGVVAFMAASGGGKTTLASELLGRGWRLFADDQLTLGRERDAVGVRAYPGTGHMNVSDDSAVNARSDWIEQTLVAFPTERWVTARRCARRPRRVRLLCLLQRGAGMRLHAEPLSANPLALAPYMLGLARDTTRLRSRFDLFADLSASSGLVRLTGGPTDSPADLADLVERCVSVPGHPPLEVI